MDIGLTLVMVLFGWVLQYYLYITVFILFMPDSDDFNGFYSVNFMALKREI